MVEKTIIYLCLLLYKYRVMLFRFQKICAFVESMEARIGLTVISSLIYGSMDRPHRFKHRQFAEKALHHLTF